MNEALTPQEKEFFDLGRAPKEEHELPILQTAPPLQEPSQNQLPGNLTMQTQFSAGGSINARGVDPAITTALMRASLERRIQRATPFTHREIIIEAITEWLKKNGYFN